MKIFLLNFLSYIKTIFIYIGITCFFLDIINGGSIHIELAEEALFLKMPFLWISAFSGFSIEYVVQSFIFLVLILLLTPFLFGYWSDLLWITIRLWASMTSIFFGKLVIAFLYGSYYLGKLPYMIFERKTSTESKQEMFESIRALFSEYSNEYSKIEYKDLPEHVINTNNPNLFSEKLGIFFNNIPVSSNIVTNESVVNNTPTWIYIAVGVLTVSVIILAITVFNDHSAHTAGSTAVNSTTNYARTLENSIKALEKKVDTLEKQVNLNYKSTTDRLNTLATEHNNLLAQTQNLSSSLSTLSNLTRRFIDTL